MERRGGGDGVRGRMNVSFEPQAALYAVSSKAYATAPMAVPQVAAETRDKVTRGSQARLGLRFFGVHFMQQVLILVGCSLGTLLSFVNLIGSGVCILGWVCGGMQDISLVCLLCRVSAVATSGLLQHWVCMCSFIQKVSGAGIAKFCCNVRQHQML